MTPKEKAHQLFDKYYKKVGFREYSKQCALIAVDDIINEYQSMSDLESYILKGGKQKTVIDLL